VKLPIFRRINREDLKEAPDWIGNLLYPLNNVFETVYNTLNRNITFQDNFLSFQRTIDFTTSQYYCLNGTWEPLVFAIPDSFRVKISGVIILSLRPTDINALACSDATSLTWLEDNRTVSIDWIAGLEESTKYSLTVLVV
jgi:hypothetical protein